MKIRYEGNKEFWEIDVVHILINKEWAKAFYGTHKVDEEGNEIDKKYIQNWEHEYGEEYDPDYDTNTQEVWEYHLPKQVMADNMLDYIKEHLKHKS